MIPKRAGGFNIRQTDVYVQHVFKNSKERLAYIRSVNFINFSRALSVPQGLFYLPKLPFSYCLNPSRLQDCTFLFFKPFSNCRSRMFFFVSQNCTREALKNTMECSPCVGEVRQRAIFEPVGCTGASL
jgi:hypothetical protein